MRKWIDTKGLKFKLWTYFGLLAAIIMIILWLLQIIFLRTYYESMKIKEIEKIGESIAQTYGQADFNETVYQTSYKNGIEVHVLDEYGKPVLGMNLFENFRPFRNNHMEMRNFVSKVKESGNGKITYMIDEGKARLHIVVFGKELAQANGTKVYLRVRSSLAPVSATQKVLQNQLLIVTVISLLIAFVLSYFIANRLSKPISKITNSANVLAKGDYNVVFEEDGYTEINELANVLNHTTKELSKTDELRRDLIANVSHDLRTPLTIIKSYAEMIRDISGDNPVKREAHTQVIVDESDRLSVLVNDMLDLSKMEAGTVAPKLESFKFTKTVEHIIKSFEVLEENEGYQFEVQLGQNLSAFADEQKISQVVYNLIHNAINYTGEDKLVRVSLEDLDDKVRFSVSDTGKGIASEDIPRVWERYYRSSQKHRRTDYGSGIGLSIVKSILEMHKAQYGVNSKLGMGTTFWFMLHKFNNKDNIN